MSGSLSLSYYFHKRIAHNPLGKNNPIHLVISCPPHVNLSMYLSRYRKKTHDPVLYISHTIYSVPLLPPQHTHTLTIRTIEKCSRHRVNRASRRGFWISGSDLATRSRATEKGAYGRASLKSAPNWVSVARARVHSSSRILLSPFSSSRFFPAPTPSPSASTPLPRGYIIHSDVWRAVDTLLPRLKLHGVSYRLMTGVSMFVCWRSAVPGFAAGIIIRVVCA